MFPIEAIFKIISDNNYLISYHIYSLISQTYVKNDPNKNNLILDKICALLQKGKNIAQFNLVYELINKDFQAEDKRKEIIERFINLIKINFEELININTLVNAIFYCKLIIENNKLFDGAQIEKAKNYIFLILIIFKNKIGKLI